MQHKRRKNGEVTIDWGEIATPCCSSQHCKSPTQLLPSNFLPSFLSAWTDTPHIFFWFSLVWSSWGGHRTLDRQAFWPTEVDDNDRCVLRAHLWFCLFGWVTQLEYVLVNAGQAWQWCVIQAQRIPNPIIKETIMHAAFPLLMMTPIMITTKITGHCKQCTLHNSQQDSWDVGPKTFKDFKLFWLQFIESEIDKNVNHNDKGYMRQTWWGIWQDFDSDLNNRPCDLLYLHVLITLDQSESVYTHFPTDANIPFTSVTVEYSLEVTVPGKGM